MHALRAGQGLKIIGAAAEHCSRDQQCQHSEVAKGFPGCKTAIQLVSRRVADAN